MIQSTAPTQPTLFKSVREKKILFALSLFQPVSRGQGLLLFVRFTLLKMAQRVRMKDGGSLVALIADEVCCCCSSPFGPEYPLVKTVLTLDSSPSSSTLGHHRWFLARRSWKR